MGLAHSNHGVLRVHRGDRATVLAMLPKITSRRNPIVARFREAARGADPDLLLLDGIHLVQGALDAGLELRHVVVSADFAAHPEVRRIVEQLRRRKADLASASAAVMEAVSPVRSASPIVALAERPASAQTRMYAAEGPVLIAADVQDPGNLGAMVRVADAGGAAGLVAGGRSANPFAWKALRGSMASALRLPIVIDRDLASSLETARGHGRQIVATLPRGGTPYLDADLGGPIAILIGGEGDGLPPGAIEAADRRVTIPMTGGVESLNAAVAAAILVYEARRQRTAKRA